MASVFALGALLWPQPVQAAPPAPSLPVLVPTVRTDLLLRTHAAVLRLEQSDNGQTRLLLQATYSFQNPNPAATGAAFRIDGGNTGSTAVAIAGQPLALATNADGLPQGEIQLPADSTLQLDLTFIETVASNPLVSIAYPVGKLGGWSNQVAFRLLFEPGNLPPEAWLAIRPDTWTFAAEDDATGTPIEWLYDGNLPDTIQLQLIQPAAWSALQQAERAAAAGTPFSVFATLGDLYETMAIAATEDNNPGAADRFFAQAIAAYLQGIRIATAAGGAASDIGALHAGLATIYRNRSVLPTGEVDVDYAESMLAEVNAALPALPADHPRRAELLQWQTEGLRTLLAAARREGDIGAALDLIDRLATGATGESEQFLAEQRQALVVQQSLELLEEGDRLGALALAGDAILDPALQAPVDLRTLFDRWQFTVTVTAAETRLEAAILPHPDRKEAAAGALQSIVADWQKAELFERIGLEPAAEPAAEPGGWRLELAIADAGDALDAARLLPQRGDWVLLRTLLTQLAPKVERTVNGFNQTIDFSLPIDLRSAGDQWHAIAAELEQQATEAATAAVNAPSVNDSQRSRILAANLRAVAQEWRSMRAGSWVYLTLRTVDGPRQAERAWLVNVESPPQMLAVELTTLNIVMVALSVLATLIVLGAVSTLLWYLL